MAIHGRKDDDDSKKASLVKAQQNGFGQPGVAGKKKFNATELFEERAAERLPELVDKALDAIDRGLSSTNTKIAMDAAYKLHKTYYQPDQKVIVEGPSHNEIHLNLLQVQDKLNPKERAVLETFQNMLKEGVEDENRQREEDIIDVEVDELPDEHS